MKKRIAILTEKNQLSGNGHFMRMKGLQSFLIKKKINCKIFLLKKNKNFKLIKEYNPSLIVCDLKNYNTRNYQSLFRNKTCKIIDIENYDNPNYDFNISVIDHNKKIKKKRLEGLDFAMIRPEIKKKITYDKKNLIFINLGSKESIAKIKKISFILEKLSINYKFVFITKFFKYFNNVEKDNRFKYYSKKFFLKYFKLSALTIISGGLILIEALYLKKKIIVIPQTKYEIKFSNYLKKRTKNICIGVNSLKDKLINNLMKKRNKVIIDGLGYNRIYKVLSKFI